MKSITLFGALRILRFIIGAIAIVQAFALHDIVLGAIGFWVSSMALFNVGCCGANGCATNTNLNKTANQETTDIEYTEVK